MLIEPYMHRLKGGVWVCPSDFLIQEQPEYAAFESKLKRGELGWSYYTSYHRSNHFFGFNPCDAAYTWDPFFARSAADVSNPSQRIAFYEGRDWEWCPAPRHLETLMNSPFITFINNPRWQTGTWHRGKGNYLFADGHVKLLSFRQTLTPTRLWDRVADWYPYTSDILGNVSVFNYDPQKTLRLLNQVKYP